MREKDQKDQIKSQKQRIREQKIQAAHHAAQRRGILGFLVLAILGAAGGWAAKRWIGGNPEVDEGLREEANRQLVERLKGLLGVEPGLDRDTVVASTRDRVLAEPNWLKGMIIGEFVNNRGEVIQVRINDRGQDQFSTWDQTREASTLYHLDEQNLEAEEVFSFGNNYLAVYGSARLIGKIGENREIWERFLEEYFGNSTAENRVLHLNFRPSDDPPRFRDVGDIITEEQEIWEQRHALVAQGSTIAGHVGDQIAPVRIDVFLNLNQIHGGASAVGIDVERYVYITLANEAINVQGFDLGREQVELPSTLAGLWAGFGTAEERDFTCGGPTHRLVVPDLVAEMEGRV